MAGLSRRAFLAAVSGLSAAWALPREALGMALSSDPVPSQALSTLQQTIRIGPVQRASYRTLVAEPGESFTPRLDLFGQVPDPGRVARRRSLVYLGHLSDIHVMDVQSPARLEPLIAQDHTLWAGAYRPQDALSTQVAASMVKALADLRTSPVTGAPMSAAVFTGDAADMLSQLETRWYIDLLDGVPVTPDSGLPGVFQGVQAWADATYAYHPEDPRSDMWGAYGFPTVPGFLQAAIAGPVDSGGLPVPWYAVYGNHDTTYIGTLGVPAGLRAFAVGDRKAVEWPAVLGNYVGSWAADASALTRWTQAVATNLGVDLGMRAVTPDPRRRLLEQQDFMRAHLQTAPNPGPIGHGFTPAAIEAGITYWQANVGPFARIFGLDTCNQVAGPDGAVPRAQLDWLEAGLGQCQAEGRLAIILSHHNSYTLENSAALVSDPTDLVHAEEFIATVLRYPCAIAWLNGHTHNNTITAHPRGGGSGGLWEITSASCIDFPQQEQVVDIVDNRDGTLSLFTVVVDHAASPQWDGDLSTLGLASLSRQLSANDWVENPVLRRGSELDRNTELLLPAPFDMTAITDAALEQAHAADRARLLAWESGWSA